MAELNEELRKLIREYVVEVLAEERSKDKLEEVVTIRSRVQATRADRVDLPASQFVVLEPGQYILSNVETRNNQKIVSLVSLDGEVYPPLIAATHIGPTALGNAVTQ